MTDNQTPKVNTSGEESRFEAISALVDGETNSDLENLLDNAACDQDCKDAWQRYHLVRDVMQRDYHPALSADFASRVSQSLDNDLDVSDSGPNVMSFAAKTEQLKARRGSTRRTWLPVAGLGLAASVAAAGFIAWQANKSQSGLGGAPTELAQNTVESDTSPGNTSQSVLLANATVRTVYQREPGTRWVVSTSAPRDKQVEQRLNSLLINHLEDSTMGRVQGMMAHSRVVSYDSGVVNESF